MSELPNPFAGGTMQGYSKIPDISGKESPKEAAEKILEILKVFAGKCFSFLYDLSEVMQEVVLPFCYLSAILLSLYFSLALKDSTEKILAIIVLYVLLRFYKDLFYKEEYHVRKR